jgi:Domain of unknown function (DUF4148)
MDTNTRAMFAALLIGGASSLAQAGTTREQVMRELEEARQNGEIRNQETGLQEFESNPSRYPQRQAPAGRTREEVRAEFLAAQKSGDLIVGENGERANELNPSMYPPRSKDAGAVAPPPKPADLKRPLFNYGDN